MFKPAAQQLGHRADSEQPDVHDLIAWIESKHRKNTRGVNHALLHHIENFLGRKAYLSDFTEDFCFSFANFLMTRVSMSSERTYLQRMHTFLERAASAHLIPSNPMPSVRELMPTVKKTQRVYLTKNELSNLAAAPCRHKETKRAFLFACQTGLRLSDIETLMWEDIVESNGQPTIMKVQVKTGREVCIPLNTVALKLLGTRTGERVFSLKSRSVVSADLVEWAKAAGVGKHLTFHVSRHTFATMSICAGVDIYVVSRLCGHATVRTTEIYAHVVDKTLQNGIMLLEQAMVDNCETERKSRWTHIKEHLKRKVVPLVQRCNGIIFHTFRMCDYQ